MTLNALQATALPDAEAAQLVAMPAEAKAARAGLIVAVPALAGFAVDQREITALLPVVDINGALIAAAADYADLGGRAVGQVLCAGFLAVDPFLVVDDLAAALRDGGFGAVANFPTMQLLDGEAGAGLAAVGYGLAAELRQLTALAHRGFAVHVYVVDAASARAAQTAGFTDLVFHAAFRPPAEASDALAAVRAAAVGSRVRIHAPGR